jgi:hypothetical protein
MNDFDPTAPECSNLSLTDQELSVETLQIQSAELETTETTDETAEISAQAGAEAAIPIPLLKRLVSGRYRSAIGFWQLELRVDVDGVRPMKRVSGDFFQRTGATVTYFGSFIVNAPSINVTATTVTIEGVLTSTYATSYPKVKVTIPRVSIFQPPAAATIQFFSLANAPGAIYVCAFESRYFRTVQYEQDSVSDVATPVFSNYNTGSLPSGGPVRVLSVPKAYEEAGIQMQTAGIWNVIPVGGAGANLSWSNAELHSSMVTRFSLWREEPQWKVWLLAAQKHDIGPGLYGIMFDQQGKQRQGCATFHLGIGGITADKLRLQLYTYVHELGHCFNLLHSWQKSFAVPPVPNRPSSLSWMNYPWNYPAGGAAGFWSAFPFQFDDQELIHLRHAYRNNVIMGGNNFAVGAGLEGINAFADAVEDNSGLRFSIEAQRSYGYGQPIHLKFKLEVTSPNGKQAHTELDPNTGFVQVGIRKPNGQVVIYEPLMHQCIAPEVTILDANRPDVEDSTFIGYGKGGFYFDQAGVYQLRAIYFGVDGSQVLSNIETLRVRHPVTAAEEEIADLFFGEEQGTLFYLNGSDSESLSRGKAALETVVDKYGKNSLANYARIALGTNLGRRFKTITTENTIQIREPKSNESIKLISAGIEGIEDALDPNTLDKTLECLAQIQSSTGDDKGATATRKRLRRGPPRVARVGGR